VIGKQVRRIACAMVVGISFAGAASAQSQYTQIAGGAFGDGGAATAANMQGATDVVVDAAGNIYVSQFNANRIRKIATNGVVTTLIGGTTGFSGDNGLAINAAMDRPDGLAVDSIGNVYFSDRGNRRVRRIAPNGVITTIAGNGSGATSGDNGLAVNAGVTAPSGLVLDAAGNLYIADQVANRIRKVTPGGIITTVAGTGVEGFTGDMGQATAATLSRPTDVDIDSAGNLYITDLGNTALRKVAANGVINTIFTSTNMSTHTSVDGAGNLYFADIGACALMKLTGPTVTRIVGSGTACGDGGNGTAGTATNIGAVEGIAIDSAGNVIFVDADYARVRKLTKATSIHTIVAGIGGDIPNGTLANNAALSANMGIAVATNGDLVMSELTHRRVRRLSAGRVYTLGGSGLFKDRGTCATALPCPATDMVLYQIYGVAYGNNGAVLVADRGRARVFSITPDGNLGIFAGTTRSGDNGDGGPAGNAIIDPYGLARDAAGNIYITDTRANRIRKVDTGGTITTIAGTGAIGFSGDGGPATSAKLSVPTALAIDAAGNLYVADNGNLRVRKITPTGVITTIAGNGADAITGNGGAATSAAIGQVRGIAVDTSGAVYLAGNGTLRRVRTDGRIESLPGWTHYSMSLAFRSGLLYVGTQEGLIYTLPVGSRTSDYDGDGRSDILWRNGQTGANALWKAANSAQAQTLTGASNLAWKILGQGDFDGDGKDDIFWRNVQDGSNVIWRSANYATQIAVSRVPDLNWSMVGVGDFDNDGKADLVWRHGTTGQNVIWRSGNSATTTTLTSTTDKNWKIVGVGDFNGDGVSDLLWRNVVTGANVIWRSGNFASSQAVTGVTDVAWKVQAVGDFNGDGGADIFWRKPGTGQNVIWNDALSTSTRAVATAVAQWSLVAVGDYDGDGKSDLLWRNTVTGAGTIWLGGDATKVQAVTGVTNQAWTVVPYEFQR